MPEFEDLYLAAREDAKRLREVFEHKVDVYLDTLVELNMVSYRDVKDLRSEFEIVDRLNHDWVEDWNGNSKAFCSRCLDITEHPEEPGLCYALMVNEDLRR